MNKEKGECRISYKFVKAIAASDMQPRIKVLHWFYSKLRFHNDYKDGFIEVKSFTKEADSIGMKKQDFMRCIRYFEACGLFKIVIKNYDSPCHKILCQSVIKNYDAPVIKNYDAPSYKDMTETPKKDNGINKLQPPNHFFKQLEDKALSQAMKNNDKKTEDENMKRKLEPIDLLVLKIREIFRHYFTSNWTEKTIKNCITPFIGKKEDDFIIRVSKAFVIQGRTFPQKENMSCKKYTAMLNKDPFKNPWFVGLVEDFERDELERNKVELPAPLEKLDPDEIEYKKQVQKNLEERAKKAAYEKSPEYSEKLRREKEFNKKRRLGLI